MFYFIEIINRLKYIISSFCLLFFSCYFNYNTIFSFLDILFKELLKGKSNPFSNYYIYTHPFELYYTQLVVSFQLAFYLFIPYFFWQIFDFIKTALYNSEFILIVKTCRNFTYSFIVSYYLIYVEVLPLFFTLLNSAKQTYNSSLYDIFFELKVQDFIHFIFYLNNILIFILIFLFILITLLNNCNTIVIIKHKKLLYLFVILFATFASPPDLFSQVFLIITLTITIELILFLKIYNYYK